MSDRVYIFDTTLRDGEQSPGATMNLDEKEPDEEIYTTLFRVISNFAANNGYVQRDITVLPQIQCI